MKHIFLILFSTLAFACSNSESGKVYVPKTGETIVLKGDLDYVIATRDRYFLPEMNSIYLSKDKKSFAEMIKSEKAIAIENGTKAKVIETGFAVKILVLEKAYENEVVWTNVDWIKPLPDK